MRHWLPATFIVLALALALALFAFTRPGSRASSPEDDEARRIVEVCAGGFAERGKAGLSANLARQLRRLEAASEVSSEQVGAVIATIRPDEIGRDVYEIYVRCLKQQTEFSLLERGVRIDDASDRKGQPETAPAPAPAPTDSSSRAKAAQPETAARTTATRPPRTSGTTSAAQAMNKTEGDCSPIFVGSTVGNVNQQCTETTR